MMVIDRRLFIGLAGGWLTSGRGALAAQGSRKPLVKLTGVFGRLRSSTQGGDLVGLEIFILRGRKGLVAVVSIAEGVPEDPVVVPVVAEGDAIRFEFLNGQTKLKYQGTIRSDGLYGRFENGAFSDRADGYFLLPRGSSYWQ